MSSSQTEDRVRRRASVIGGSGVSMPVVTFTAPLAGPTVAIGANLHGDECTGIGVAHALMDRLAEDLQRGTVHIYPSLNPRGLEDGTRRMPGDALDPNRAFPGTARGTQAQRHAWRIWTDLTARRPDLFIDLHTDAGGAMPYAIVDRVIRGRGGRMLAQRCVELAEASGLTVLREYPPDRYRRFDLDRSLPGALCNGLAIPAVTLEVGPRRRIDPAAVRLATRSVLGILTSLHMAQRPAPAHESLRSERIWRRESGPRTTRSGVLLPMVRPGVDFKRGAALAQVRSLGGELREVLRAPCDGFVVSLPERTSVGLGVATSTLAVPEEPGLS
jgi:predicted deacylase